MGGVTGPLNPGRPPRGLPDDALLDAVSQAALDYFWTFAHPVSGMARERSAGAFGYDVMETVTTGGTGFGVMALVAGASRGWLARDAVRERVARIVAFLDAAERHHGVFPHFMNGTTGATIPFSPEDDGGDLPETSFLVAGLLAAREAFRDDIALTVAIDRVWHGIDWAAHLRPGDGALMWHRSASRPWTGRSLPIRGWNECLVTYVLAVASPGGPIPAAAYHDCWACGEQFATGQECNGIRLPLGPEGGGPMFLSHYAFLGLDPRGLRDRYADYGEQVRAHARINRAHCVANPHGHAGYGPDCWGLTASDTPGGYAAHSPAHDLGVISPTAAIGSMPYTPAESMRALRHFVDDLGDRLWGRFGLADAFCPATDWVAPGNLAIDQGPIVVMIENHRSGLIWDLFMSAPEVQQGLRRLGFSSPHL